MPNPEEFTFQVRSPKGPPVKVGEELEFRLTADAELRLRVQCLERAISRIPIVGLDYARELREAGLEKSDLRITRYQA